MPKVLDPTRCELCGDHKTPRTYNTAVVGEHLAQAWLCVRCDLSGDKPLKFPGEPPT